MKAWLYSATSVGALRASWPLLDKDKEANECGVVEPLELAESAAKQALEHLDAKVDEAKSLDELRASLLAIAACSDAWQAIQPTHWQEGIQIVVVDYLLPDGSPMFIPFTFPYHQILDDSQLSQLVERVVDGQGGCCS